MTTSMPKRRASSAAKLRAAPVISFSEPSTLYGSPTTAMSGCQSRIIVAINSQRGPLGPAGTVSRAEALRLKVSPQATPILRRPKSKARTIFGRDDSGISAGGADSGQFHAQQAAGRVPARFERQVENQALIHRGAEPGIGANLLLQLAAVPAGIAQGDDGLGRTLAARHGGQNIARGRHMQRIGNLERRIPFTVRAVYHEAAIGLHGAPSQGLAVPPRAQLKLDFQLLEDFAHAHRQRLGENEAQGPA